MKKNKVVQLRHLGKLSYQEGWEYQTKLFDAQVALKIENRKSEESEQKPTKNYLLFVEHPPVFTLGKSGKEQHLLLNEEELIKKGASFYKINRGGDITFHGPGQVVGYPIFDLDNFFTDIHKYLRFLEEAVIRTLQEYQIIGTRIDGLTGVWIDADRNPRKICALGVKSSRWVTMHGFALNVNTDLDFFDYIVPCGISDKAVTSMEKELGKKIDIAKVEQSLAFHLSNLFEMKLTENEE